MANARDEQVFRETLVSFKLNTRDQQVFRETLISSSSHARDLQVFRESVVQLKVGSSKGFIVSFVVT